MIPSRPTLPFLCAVLAGLTNAAPARAEPAPHVESSPVNLPAAAAAAKPVASPSLDRGAIRALAGLGPAANPPLETPAPAPAATARPPAPALTTAASAAATAANATPIAPAILDADTKHREIVGLQKIGLSLTERGEWDAAAIAFRQIMTAPAAQPADLAQALLGLARVHRRAGALTKAAAVYERFLKDYPADHQVPDALLELGRTLRALGANQLALAQFYSVLNSTLKLPAEGFAHYQMLARTAQFEIAETHFQQGDFAEANKFYSRLRLLDLAPADRARAHFKSAYALYLGGDLAGAVTTLRSYLEQWPHDDNVPEARYLLSRSLHSLGRKDEALEATLDLLRTQQASGDAQAWSYWQRRTGNQLANDFFQGGDTTSALAVYQSLAALSSDPAWLLPVNYQIGLCFERLRATDRAIAAYQSVVDGARTPAAAATATPLPADGAAAPAANPELVELAHMAAWRIQQISWDEHTERQLNSIFASGVVPESKTPLASAAAGAIVPDDSPAPTPAASPAHVPSGNPATASPSL